MGKVDDRTAEATRPPYAYIIDNRIVGVRWSNTTDRFNPSYVLQFAVQVIQSDDPAHPVGSLEWRDVPREG